MTTQNETALREALKAIKTQLSHLYHNGQIRANAPERERIQICIVNAEYALENSEPEPCEFTHLDDDSHEWFCETHNRLFIGSKNQEPLTCTP